MGEDILGVEEERGAEPRGAGEKCGRNRDKFHRKAKRLFLNLRERLEKRNENADHRRDNDRNQRKAQHNQKACLRIVK